MATIQSSCICGQNVISFTNTPIVKFRCHCTDERKLTGAAFALNILFSSESLKVLSGTLKTWSKLADSGNTITNHSLNQVYPENNPDASKAAKVDIILVHGLNPKSKDDEAHMLNTWTENGRLWPKDDLPKRLPDARISLYVYDSSAVYGGSQATFADKANELLETIRCNREDWEGRPLILMGHSLGGILIEQALINARQNETYQHIYDATACLAFFGTPHKGGSGGMVTAGKTAANVALWLGFQKGDNIIETLDKGSMFTDIHKDHFRQQFESYRMVSFWGDKDTIVSRGSSKFGLAGGRERIVELKADHHGVAAFGHTTKDEGNLKKVTSNVKWLYDEALKLDDTITSRLEHSRANPRLQQNVMPKTHCIVPFEKNDRFTGRESELTQLEEVLFAEDQATKVAVFGLGGVGKTSLVIELVHRIRMKHENCSVLWIPATNLESLHQAYLDVACQFGIRGWEEDSADVKRLVQEFLSRESAGQWLVVFDNADDIDMWVGTHTEQGTKRLIDYLPRSKLGCIVFTTRDRKTAVKLAQKNVMEVPAMGEDVATLMLQEYLINPDLVSNKPDTSSLLNELIYLPLAIVQASAYINENRISFSDYLSLLADQEEDVIDLFSEEFEDDGRYQNVKNPVATTWLISFEQIRQRDPLAAEYLSFMACIDSRDIPQSLLPRGQSRKKEMAAIGTLDAYSFVTRRPGNDALDLHRLVHLSTRNWLSLRNEWDDRVNAALHRVEDMLPAPKHENRALWMSYQIHAQCVLTSTKDQEKESKEWYRLAGRIAECYLITGKYQESENLTRQTLKLKEEVLGKTHPHTLATMSNLALVLDNQGKYAEAETMNRQTLKLKEEVLGMTHPSTLATMGILALVLHSQGKYAEAESMNRQTLKLTEEVLGKTHPSTLATMSNLALVLHRQDKYAEAETMNRQTLKLKEEVLEKTHPSTLATMSNLALMLHRQGRYAEAETMNRQTLKLKEEVLGKMHPSTLTTMSNLASVLVRKGKYTQAEAINRQTLKLMEEVLGKTHPDTLMSVFFLADLLQNKKQYEEASILYERACTGFKSSLGSEHPTTKVCVNDYSDMLDDIKEAN
ncbi:hypothetical protein VF21_00911 [Pseudogymnoascus sp. 05NY08]|nr:hypothetical protein VF21_00911 [Pseudogymnoascus sp. 05NY08]